MHWIKVKQQDPTMRPRIDWIATWRPFVPFWIAVAILAAALWLIWPMVASAQTGIASVYSGGLTANGERARPYGMTAAHRTLPFGTIVRVTNQHNGRSAVVRINDRGPFIKGRIIDLMPAAARALGFDGLARVVVEVIGRQSVDSAPKRENEIAMMTVAPQKSEKAHDPFMEGGAGLAAGLIISGLILAYYKATD